MKPNFKKTSHLLLTFLLIGAAVTGAILYRKFNTINPILIKYGSTYDDLLDTLKIDQTLVNPENTSEAFIKTNNTYRRYNMHILNRALTLYISEHSGTIPSEITIEFQQISKTGADICTLLLSKYIGGLPRDPRLIYDISNRYRAGGTIYDCSDDYQTGFAIKKSEENKIILMAPLAEGNEEIIVSVN